MMNSASRHALDELGQREHEIVEGRVSADSLVELAGELYSVARVLVGQPALRRALTDATRSTEGRTGLAEQVFGGKVGRNAFDLVSAAVALRWSSSWDLCDALESAGDNAVFRAAEKGGSLNRVEDELFRLERILQAQGEVTALLDEQSVDAERRLTLLDSLVSDKVSPLTLALLHNAVVSTRKRSIALAIDDLLDGAARWQERSIARVTAAVPLSGEQTDRVAAALSELYGRPIVARTAVDPAVKGGLVVRVGDEVIDGSVATRLAAARAGFTG